MDPGPYIDLSLHAEALPADLGLTARVNIKLHNWIEELFQEPNGQQTLIRVIPPARPQLITFNLQSCSIHHVFQLLSLHLRDPSLCDYLAQKISDSARRMWFGYQGFVMFLEVNLVQELFFVLGVTRGSNGLNSGRGGGGGASDLVIEKLKMERSFRSDDIDQSDTSCSVCLEDYSGADTLTKLPCSHVFHQSCVVQWLQTKNSCPLCRGVPSEDAK